MLQSVLYVFYSASLSLALANLRNSTQRGMNETLWDKEQLMQEMLRIEPLLSQPEDSPVASLRSDKLAGANDASDIARGSTFQRLPYELRAQILQEAIMPDHKNVNKQPFNYHEDPWKPSHETMMALLHTSHQIRDDMLSSSAGPVATRVNRIRRQDMEKFHPVELQLDMNVLEKALKNLGIYVSRQRAFLSARNFEYAIANLMLAKHRKGREIRNSVDGYICLLKQEEEQTFGFMLDVERKERAAGKAGNGQT